MSIHFFATRSDLEGVLAAVESQGPLIYVMAGIFDAPNKKVLRSGLEIPNLGMTTSGNQNQQQWYLVAEGHRDVHAEEIPQRHGGVHYAVDQRSNPQSVAFRPGGVFENRSVIAGQMGTSSCDPVSAALLNLFVREFRKQFKRIKSYYVGAEASELLDKGFRLTADTRSPLEYDLAR
jgi:hypothetical protein